MILSLLSNNIIPLFFDYTSDEIKNDKKIVLDVVNRHGLSLQYVSEYLKNNDDTKLQSFLEKEVLTHIFPSDSYNDISFIKNIRIDIFYNIQ